MPDSRPLRVFAALIAAVVAGTACLFLGSLGASSAEGGHGFREIGTFYLMLLTVPVATAGGYRLGRFRRLRTELDDAALPRPQPSAHRLPARGQPFVTVLTAVISVGVGLLAAGPRIPPAGHWLDGLLRMALVMTFAALIVLGIREVLCAGAAPWIVERALRWSWLLLLSPLLPSTGWRMALWVLAMVAVLWVALRAPPARTRTSVVEVWLFLPLLTLILTYQAPGPGPLDLYHLGERMTPASELLAGETAFRDVYIQHGWIENALRTRLSFALFGESLGAELRGYAIMVALGYVSFLLLCLATLRSWWLSFCLTLALATPGFGISERLIGLLLTLTFLQLDLNQARGPLGQRRERRRTVYLLCAGMACGLSLFLSLETGLYGAGAAGLYLVLESRGRAGSLGRRWAASRQFAFGGLLGTLPFLAALAGQGALAAFAQNSLSQLTGQLPVWGLPYPPLRALIDPLLSGAVTFSEWLGSAHLLALVTALALILTPAWLLARASGGRLDRGCHRLLLLSLFGALLYRSALGRSDAGHFVFAAALLWPMLVLIAERFGRWRLLPLGLLCGFMVAAHAPLYGVAQQVLRLSYPARDAATLGFCRLPLPRAGRVLIPSSQARPLSALASELDERLPPRAPFFDFSNLPAAYFLLDRDAPTRFFVPLYAATTLQQEQLIAELERVRPRFVLEDSPLGYPELDGRSMQERLPLVFGYLERTYTVGETFSFGRLRERRSFNIEPPRAGVEGASAARSSQRDAPPEAVLRPAVARSRARRR